MTEPRCTPPHIVERAENPPAALAAFIAQELEHWGFTIEDSYPFGNESIIELFAGKQRLEVRVVSS